MKFFGHNSPYKILHDVVPMYDYITVWGRRCYVHVPDTQTNKFSPKANVCKFVGYANDFKGYHCWNPRNWSIVIQGM